MRITDHSTSEHETCSINLLPEFLVNQIKAGEVIERPASLIKEVIENSLDADSTEIEVHIVENGLELISIKDNGKGMSYEELPYAFCRHATSKINNLDDLYNLSSFGFRGEALASISSISRLICKTAKNNGMGGKIVINGSKQETYHQVSNEKQGTTLSIKDLFYNTPVRLKFIKSKNSEKNAIRKIIQSFLLSSPQTTFKISFDSGDKEIYNAVNSENYLKRVQKVFFKRSSSNQEIKKLEFSYDNYSLEAYFSKISTKGNSHKCQFLFANNRFFADKTIHALILRTMSSLWQEGTTGHYLIKIKLPQNHMDINVHPRKTQIKFLKSSLIYSLISSGLAQELKKETFSLNKKLNDNNTSSSHLNSNPFTDYFSSNQNQTESTFGQDFSYKYSQEESLAENKNTYFYLSPTYSLFKDAEGSSFIVDKRQLLVDYALHFFKVHFPFKNEEKSPLLISEPFSVLGPTFSKKTLQSLEDFGIELEYLAEDTLILRSIPQFLELLPYKELIQAIILTISFLSNQNKINNLSGNPSFFHENREFLLENIPSSSYELSEKFFLAMCNKLKNTSQKSSFKFLDQKTLEGLFQFKKR